MESQAGSQKIMCYCGASCNYLSDDDPCEGEVEVIDEVSDGEDWYWVHACTKHEAKHIY
jgi:hypothetical protein